MSCGWRLLLLFGQPTARQSMADQRLPVTFGKIYEWSGKRKTELSLSMKKAPVDVSAQLEVHS